MPANIHSVRARAPRRSCLLLACQPASVCALCLTSAAVAVVPRARSMAKSPYAAAPKDRCRDCRICTGFGRQVPSDQRTEPATVIGSGLRDDAAKVGLSPRDLLAATTYRHVYAAIALRGPHHLAHSLCVFFCRLTEFVACCAAIHLCSTFQSSGW